MVDADPPNGPNVFLVASLTGTLSQKEITGVLEELDGRIDTTSWSKTSTRQAVNPPHFTSSGTMITPDQAIQSDPLVNLSITPSDNAWVPLMVPEYGEFVHCMHLASTCVVLVSSTLSLILPELVRGLFVFVEGSGLIGWNEA